MIELTTPELQTNESLKGFETNDDLAKAYVDLHGKVASGSIELLPEDLRKDATLANYKTLSDLGKGFIETKKLVGTIKKAPATPGEYKLSPIEGLPDNVKLSPETQAAFLAEAHKAGIPNEYVDGMHKWFLNFVAGSINREQQKKADMALQNETKLREEWGGDYDKNFTAVTRMLQTAGGQELLNELGGNFKNTPLALKGLAKIAALLSEDSIKNLGGNQDQGASAIDKEFAEYSAAIASNDQKHPLMNEKSSDHLKAVKRWTELNTLKFGGEANA